jgi:ABC-type multidrug transport system ATPase subunit
LEPIVSIELLDLGKKFNREWIFRSLNLRIPQGSKIAVLGSNGSGKSTLLQTISGFLIPDNGKVVYKRNETQIPADDAYHHISFASPFLQLPEELTLDELISHYRLFKPFLMNDTNKNIASLFQLENALHKQIRHFSSGMKQRVKLGMAIASAAPILFLDEPLSNLDINGMVWYADILPRYTAHKTVLVCSNAIKDEYYFCETAINLSEYKNK